MYRVLGNQRGVYLFGTSVQENLKGGADCAFVCDVVLFVLLQRGIVVADCFVGGLKVEFRHKGMIASLELEDKGKLDYKQGTEACS